LLLLLESTEKCPTIIAEEYAGQFLPFTHVHLHRRNLISLDMAIAVKALIINRRCTHFDLFRKGISSDGARLISSALQYDTHVEMLELRSNLLCDTGVQYLACALSMRPTSLYLLDLNDNAITDTGVRLLATMLKSNRTLRKLTLAFNRITSEGVHALVDVLINDNATLQWLSLASNPCIDDTCTQSIIRLMKDNQSLMTFNMERCTFSWWSQKQLDFYRRIYLKFSFELLL
jgi:Ran GTPase-activating protein (RanGAP) involved in mRNA processing and transport